MITRILLITFLILIWFKLDNIELLEHDLIIQHEGLLLGLKATWEACGG